jgi:hypothetical protein
VIVEVAGVGNKRLPVEVRYVNFCNGIAQGGDTPVLALTKEAAKRLEKARMPSPNPEESKP